MSAASSAAQTLEVRAVGTVADGTALEDLAQLLVALSGAQPSTFEQLEVVLRPPTASAEAGSTVPAGWKPDLRLQHDLAASSSAGSGPAAAAGDRWAGDGRAVAHDFGRWNSMCWASALGQSEKRWLKDRACWLFIFHLHNLNAHLPVPPPLPTTTVAPQAAGTCCSSA